MTDKTQALLPVTRAIDAKEEWPAFQSWWSRHRPGDAVPSPSSLIFDAWMQSARHRMSHSIPGDVGMREAALDLCDKPEWIKHRGGANPVSPHQLVEIKHRAGSTAIVAAGAVGWRHGAFIWEIMGTAPEADIVAYRLVNDYKLNKLLAALTPSPCPGDGTPAWRTIDSAPTDGQTILAICASAYTPTAFDTWWQDGWTHYSRPDDKWHGGVGKWFPTHWMPREVYLAALTPSALSGEAGEKP